MLLYISRDDVFFFSPADPLSVWDLIDPMSVAQINIHQSKKVTAMSHFHNHPHFFNQPILLSKERQNDPKAFLERFFDDYNMCELRA